MHGQGIRAQHAFIGRQTNGRLPPHALGAESFQASDESAHDCPNDLILDREKFILTAIEALGPNTLT
jgi:hypothetical protein